MFLEVCLLSLGLFTGSELYKKIESSFGGESHNCGLRKKQEQPVPCAETQERGKTENSSAQEHAEFSSALESLTEEVSRLREDFSEYIAVDKHPVRNSESSPPAAEQSPVPRSSIFEKLIKENVTLREGQTGE
jgi:hypothetical protein